MLIIDQRHRSEATGRPAATVRGGHLADGGGHLGPANAHADDPTFRTRMQP